MSKPVSLLFVLFCAASKGDDEARPSSFCRAKENDLSDCKAATTNAELLAKLGESNRLPALVEQDRERAEVLLSALGEVSEEDVEEGAVSNAKDKFYEVTSLVLQTHCTVGKKCGYFLGDTFVCLDKLYADEDSGADCLVYSFASGKTDWTFERAMALAGCRVRAFDPTVTAGHQRPPDLPDSVELHPFALSDKSGEVDLVMPSTKKGSKKTTRRVTALTLSDVLSRMGDGDDGHVGSEISYLKVDIAGAELDALPQMVSSGAVGRVRQIGVSFRTGPAYLAPTRQPVAFLRLVRAFQRMHTELGFRLVHYALDGCTERTEDPFKIRYTNFDAVWYRPDLELSPEEGERPQP